MLKKRLADGIFIVKGSTEAWNELSNNDDVILLPKDHRFSKLYAEYIHNIDHLGVNANIAKIRAVLWIVGTEKLMKAIRYN